MLAVEVSAFKSSTVISMTVILHNDMVHSKTVLFMHAPRLIPLTSLCIFGLRDGAVAVNINKEFTRYLAYLGDVCAWAPRAARPGAVWTGPCAAWQPWLLCAAG